MIVAIDDSIYELALKQLFIATDWSAAVWHCARLREDIERLPLRTLLFLAQRFNDRPENPDYSIDKALRQLHEVINMKIEEAQYVG